MKKRILAKNGHRRRHKQTSSTSSSTIRKEACPICTKIAGVKETDRYGVEIATFGAFKKQTSCPTCQNVVKWFGKAGQLYDRHDRSVVLDFRGEGYWHLAFLVQSVLQSLYLDRMYDVAAINLMDHRWIDTNLINTWVKECNDSHAGKCHTITDPLRTYPQPEHLILIDVMRRCLVRGKGTDQYAALSYVWEHSTTTPFQSCLENFDALCQENAFEGTSRLPKTIYDSMVLTGLLGIKYLWVDRFCIVQDDDRHKASQLNSMASVYANSYVTIMAEDGDGTHGLHGIRETQIPREMPVRSFHFGPNCWAVSAYRMFHYDWEYHRRGWTFQEMCISRRILIIGAGTATLACRTAHWTERFGNISKPQPDSMVSIDRFVPKDWLVNSQLYCKMVEEYSKRQLTYAEDILTAFGAITTTASRYLETEILYGMPEIVFDHMLLWQGYDPLKERQPFRRRQNEAGEVLLSFPSWSWAGWTGTVHFYYLDDRDQSKNTVPLVKVNQTITWYKWEIVSGIKVPIKPMSLEHQHRHCSSEEEEHSRSALSRGIRSQETSFDASRSHAPEDSRWSSIISCRTRRLRLLIGDQFQNFGSAYSIVQITDEAGNVVGAAYLNSPKAPGQPGEWICLSEGETDLRLGWKKLIHIPDARTDSHKNCKSEGRFCDIQSKDCKLEEKDRIYKFYNIMWIEWEDDIAYRKAIGRVNRNFWDNAPTEEIDVRLG